MCGLRGANWLAFLSVLLVDVPMIVQSIRVVWLCKLCRNSVRDWIILLSLLSFECFSIYDLLMWLCALILSHCPPGPALCCPLNQHFLPWFWSFFQFPQFWLSQSIAFEAVTRLSHVVSGYRYSIVLHKGFVLLRNLASCHLWTAWSIFHDTCCQSEFLERGVIYFTLSWCFLMLPDPSCLSLVQFTLGRRCGSRQRSAPGGGVGFFNLSCEVHIRRGRGWKFTTYP